MNIYVILLYVTSNQPLCFSLSAFFFHVPVDVAASNPGKQTSNFQTLHLLQLSPHTPLLIYVLSLKTAYFSFDHSGVSGALHNNRFKFVYGHA